MTTYAYPFKDPFIPISMSWGSASRTLMSESPLSGTIQTSGVPGKRWVVKMVLRPNSLRTSDRGARREIEAFLDSLCGQQHRVTMFHMGTNRLNGYGTPSGTINLTGVTVKTTASQFSTSVILQGCTPSSTLKAGDMFKIGNMLMMNPSDAVANGSGDMTVSISGGLRVGVTALNGVIFNKPTSTFVMMSNSWESGYTAGENDPIGIDFTEVLL